MNFPWPHLCCALLLALTVPVAAQETELAWLESCQARIEDQRLPASDLSILRRWAQGPEGDKAAQAKGLLAIQLRVAGETLQAAGSALGSMGLKAGVAERWLQAEQKLTIRGQAPRLVEALPTLPASIPASSVPAALALAVTLGAMDAPLEGAALIQLVGLTSPGLTAVRAQEAAGDLNVRPGAYGQAVELYQGALGTLERLRTSSAGDALRPADGVEGAIQTRLQARLAKAQRLWDEERYGPGFVAYRAAEQLRRGEGRQAEALLANEDLVSAFPGTIWAEAGAAYRIHCLYALAEGGAPQLEAARQRLDAIRLAAEQRLDERRRAAAPAAAVAEARAELLAAQSRLKRCLALPQGQAAAAAAQQGIEALLASAEFGLYRGEALLAAATWAMEGALDPQAAAPAFARCADWLARVGAVDSGLAALRVPDQAAAVAAAPAESLTMDREGIPSRSIPAIGAVLNRQSCSWYLDDLREQVALGQAFLAFHAGKLDEAAVSCAQALTLEGPAGRMDRQGTWNDVSRLRWAIEHGWFYAQPDELTLYQDQGRQRFVVLVADFRFCTQRFDRAVHLAERLLAGEFGNLRGAARDYPLYLRAACRYWQGERAQACAGYREVLAQRDGTLTEDRAALALGNLSWTDAPDAATTRAGHQALLELAGSPRNNEFALRARLIMGVRLIRCGQEPAGLALLKRIPSKADAYHQLAQDWVVAVEGLRAQSPEPTPR